MSRLGFKSVRIYHGETFLGELEAVPVKDSKDFQFPNNEIRISHISQPFERSPPLSVLQTISSFSVRCKLVSNLPSNVSNLPPNDPLSHLLGLHASCFHQHKTAVVVFGAEEIHLVAMPSKEKKFPCFWCCSVRVGLYNSCLSMLNLRCLAIVFDLDETLIVANSLKSFEDRIEALKVWISREMDPIRLSGMAAELKRYSDDRALLKQFADHDCVTDCGILYKAQFEDVPQLSENHEKFARPVIRLPEKNIVLTRINPENRDTSVLVRLRPAWEDLRSYLTAKGRKRFEVFVCTMAERDYAFEIWRLLDPEHHLINIKQLLNRVVCVKPGSKKSLLNVFHDGVCHPNLAMVIDDRLKVWEDKDQPRVHVVPAFSPYYAPQAETAHPVPVLCVARNVACNVRGGFFKEFDENLHKRIIELSVEDDTSNLPPPPDVSNFLLVEDTGFALPNGSVIPMPEGMSGAEVEQRLHPRDERLATDSAATMQPTVPELRPEIAPPLTAPASNITNPPFPSTTIAAAKPSLLGVPVKKDGLVSELNIDKKRKLSMTKHGIDGQNPISADPPLLRYPSQTPAVPAQCSGGWLAEDDTSRGKADKHRALHNTPNYSTPGELSDLTRGRVQEVGTSHESLNPTFLGPNQAQGLGNSEAAFSQSQVSSVNKEYCTDALRSNTICSSLSINVLHEIGRRCNSRVEFRSVVSTRHDLQFSIEVLLTGETIGVGMGKTRKDAQQQAAENALQSLAEGYAEFVRPTSETANRDYGKVSPKKENGFIWDDADSKSADERCGGESTSECTEMPIGSSSIASQQPHDSNLHRLHKSGSSKWLKDDAQRGSQGISSRQQKNGNRPIL